MRLRPPRVVSVRLDTRPIHMCSARERAHPTPREEDEVLARSRQSPLYNKGSPPHLEGRGGGRALFVPPPWALPSRPCGTSIWNRCVRALRGVLALSLNLARSHIILSWLFSFVFGSHVVVCSVLRAGSVTSHFGHSFFVTVW